MMTLSSTVPSTNAAALPTDCWRELDGRMFLCNAAGRPIHYGLDPVEIRAIVEESLTRRAGLGDRMSLDDQERQRRVAGIVRALFSVVSQDLRYLDAFEAAHRLATEFGQWQVASALALDVALMHAAVRRLGESRVRQAVQLWVAQVRPQSRLSIGDLVRVATESGHHAEGVVGRIDSSSAEYRVALTRQDRFGPAEVTLPFEFVQPHRGKQRARDPIAVGDLTQMVTAKRPFGVQQRCERPPAPFADVLPPSVRIVSNAVLQSRVPGLIGTSLCRSQV